MTEPAGKNWVRKIALAYWLPRYLPRLWSTIARADAVHTAVPGDIGTLGILTALAQRKPLFVRHCGTWGEPVTVADRLLLWLLERIAGENTVVMATGGGTTPPSALNPNIQWIFSTSISEEEWKAIEPAQAWTSTTPLRLVTVGRLSQGKNTIATIEALPLITKMHPEVHLDVVGDGPCRSDLETRVAALSLTEAVTFHGNVSHTEVLRILRNAHLFVFPTRTKEGFPKAVLEALACGLPVIATEVSVLPELIGQKNGRILDHPVPRAVAEAIMSLTADEKQWAEMAASARATSHTYTLEGWQETIGARLRERWGPLQQASVVEPLVSIEEVT